MVGQTLFWTGFGKFRPKYNFTTSKNKPLTPPSRRPRPLLAARLRNAPILQRRVAMGIPSLRRRGRKLRVLDGQDREAAIGGACGEEE